MTILYENLKKEYIKVHRKIPKHQRTPESNGKASWMRVKDGELSIIIEANRTENLGVFIAKVVVQRERAAYDEVKMNYFVLLSSESDILIDFFDSGQLDQFNKNKCNNTSYL